MWMHWATLAVSSSQIVYEKAEEIAAKYLDKL
jgi:hypothetical protein